MRLAVTYFGNVPDTNLVWYRIAIDATRAEDIDEKNSMWFIGEMMPRIQNMAKLLLGESYHSTDMNVCGGKPGICLEKGISTGKKRFLFRNFVGWVNLFSEELGIHERLRQQEES